MGFFDFLRRKPVVPPAPPELHRAEQSYEQTRERIDVAVGRLEAQVGLLERIIGAHHEEYDPGAGFVRRGLAGRGRPT